LRRLPIRQHRTLQLRNGDDKQSQTRFSKRFFIPAYLSIDHFSRRMALCKVASKIVAIGESSSFDHRQTFDGEVEREEERREGELPRDRMDISARKNRVRARASSKEAAAESPDRARLAFERSVAHDQVARSARLASVIGARAIHQRRHSSTSSRENGQSRA